MKDHMIVNYEQLCTHGQSSARRAALEIAEAALRRAIPYQETLNLISLDGGTLHIGQRTLELSSIDHIYVVGVGKGAYPIAAALDERLGSAITEGVVLIKKGDTRRLPHIEMIESGHPLPDQAGIDGAKRILAILEKAGERDLIFAPITGGSSAMLNLPAEGITLEDLRLMNDLLLKSGASIDKMNTVRKHLGLMKGGRLVEYAKPAEIHTLTLNTAPPNMPWPDLSLADPTTFADAIEMLHQYGLWDKTPIAVKRHLEKGAGDPAMETPKVITNQRSFIHSVADPRSSCEAAAARAAKLGYEPHILCTAMEGDAANLGIVFAGLANEIASTGRPFTPPCALITAGETTVTIRDGVCGQGGPNQETALGFVQKLYAKHPTACVAMDTDGTDGPTDIAGGISDGETRARATALGLNLTDALERHDASTALTALSDTLLTGHTGTNIMNFRVVVIE